jgi:hypothetical protein
VVGGQELVGQVRKEYEVEVKRLQAALGDAEGRIQLLEGELRKAQALFMSDDAKQVRVCVCGGGRGGC